MLDEIGFIVSDMESGKLQKISGWGVDESWEEILKRICSGDNRVIKELFYVRCRSKFAYLASKFPSLVLEVDDVTTMAYSYLREKDWDALRRYNPQIMGLESYITMITSRKLARMLKEKLKKDVQTNHSALDLSLLNELEIKEENDMQKKAMLFDMLEVLPSRDKLVLMYYYWHGYTVKEIGEVLGIKPDSVYVVVSRAIEKLKNEFRNDL